MLIDYGLQVGMNYAQGYRGKDAWLGKVDFFDVAVSGVVGGLTAGWGASLKAGETISKVGMFMVNNAKYVKAGEVLLTSAVDITGEGWQDVSFKQFGQRAATGLATMVATDFISDQFKKAPDVGVEQKVDNAINDATEASTAIGGRGNAIEEVGADMRQLTNSEMAQIKGGGSSNRLFFETQRQALRQAKRDLGIPTSQSHISHLKNLKTDRVGGLGSELIFEGGKSIQWHYSGHLFHPNAVPPHFNIHPFSNMHYIYGF